MAYRLRHVGWKDILAQALAICREHFAVLFKITLLLLVPFSIVFGIAALAITPELPADHTIEDLKRAHEARAAYWPFFLITALFQGFFIVPLTNASLIRAVARIYLDQSPTVMQSVQEGFRRLLPLIGTTILMTLAVLGGLLLLIIPGVLFALWFALAQHVVVLEDLGGAQALGRSKSLMRNHLGTFLALILVFIAITLLITLGSKLVPQPHLQMVVTTIAQSVATIFWIAACTVFYFSCRFDVDRFDLPGLAVAIGTQPAE